MLQGLVVHYSLRNINKLDHFAISVIEFNGGPIDHEELTLGGFFSAILRFFQLFGGKLEGFTHDLVGVALDFGYEVKETEGLASEETGTTLLRIIHHSIIGLVAQLQ